MLNVGALHKHSLLIKIYLLEVLHLPLILELSLVRKENVTICINEYILGIENMLELLRIVTLRCKYLLRLC